VILWGLAFVWVYVGCSCAVNVGSFVLFLISWSVFSMACLSSSILLLISKSSVRSSVVMSWTPCWRILSASFRSPLDGFVLNRLSSMLCLTDCRNVL